MSEKLNRPIVRLADDGQRSFDEPSALLHRLRLTVSVFEDQLRAELGEWRPGMPLDGHLVWQHHVRSGHRLHTSSLDGASALGRTAEWLSKEGWPGVRF